MNPFRCLKRSSLGRETRSQGAVEYMLMLGAVLSLVAGVMATIALTSKTLGSSVTGEIENLREEVINLLVAP